MPELAGAMYGFCQCGCGAKTMIPDHSDKSKGWIKGVPLRFLKGHNLKELAKQNAANAIGNKGLSAHGYVRVQTAEGRKYEHILVAEKMLGRKLKYFGPGHSENEVVHHKDGDKTNNAPSNLLVCSHSEHVALHDSESPKRKKKCPT